MIVTNIYELIIGGSLAAILAGFVIGYFRSKVETSTAKTIIAELEKKNKNLEVTALQQEVEIKSYQRRYDGDGSVLLKGFQGPSVFDKSDDS